MPNTDPETLLARHTAVSLAVEALIERFLPVGILATRSGPITGVWSPVGRSAGATWFARCPGWRGRLDAEIRAWWDPLGVPTGMGRPANDT